MSRQVAHFRTGLALIFGVLELPPCARPPAPPAPPALIRWEHQRDDLAGISVDLPLNSCTVGSGSIVNFVTSFQVFGPFPVYIDMSAGPLFTLEWWRHERLVGRPLRIRALTVCDAPASLVEYDEPPQPGGAGSWREPSVHVLLFARGTRAPIVAEWIVSAADRAARRREEDHFFGSFRCP